jgi:hypothetical protein
VFKTALTRMILKEKFERLYEGYYRLKVSAFSSTKLHDAIAKVPILRVLISYEGNKIHEVMSGFVYSQILHLLVNLGVFQFLKKEGRSLDEVSQYLEISNKRSLVLLRGGCALKLICYKRDKYWLTRVGAQIVGVPGLMDMIQHNQVLYQDLIDPVKLLYGRSETELSHFWPYVRKEEKKKKFPQKFPQNIVGSCKPLKDWLRNKPCRHIALEVSNGFSTLAVVQARFRLR